MSDSVFGNIVTALMPILNSFSSAPDSSGVDNVVTLLVLGAGSVVGVVFMWWGVRKVTQMIMSAFRSGRISL